MSLTTHSKFYYGYEVTADALYIDFKEGSGAELTATLSVGAYTLTDFAAELARAMNAVGGQTYTVAVDRDTRMLTISAAGAFTLLISSGSHAGTTAYGLAGFTGSNTSSSTSHQGAAAGSVYTTQFILQSYISPDDYKDSAYGTVNKSASGKLEVVSFGTVSFMQCEVKFATDISHATGAPIRSNASGLADLRAFMNYITTKGPLEFMEDEDTTAEWVDVVLESTPDDSKGLKFKLKEMYGQGLPGYFETGLLLFRVLD